MRPGDTPSFVVEIRAPTLAITPRRSLKGPLAALAIALAALYGAWRAGWAPLAPHQVLAALLDLAEPQPRAWLEAFAGLWQFVPFAFLPATCWPGRLRWALAGAGVALAAIYQIALGTPQWWLYAYLFLAGAGLVIMGFLVHQRAFAADPERRSVAGYLLAGALIFAAFGVVTKTFLVYSSANAAPVLDWSALQLDSAAFGFSPSGWAFEIARASPALRRFLAIAYETLPLAMMAVFGLEVRSPRRLPFGLLQGLFVCGFTAAAVYAMTPVAGPAYAFGTTFPEALGSLLGSAPAWLSTPPGFSPRNAFPSFHWAWALLAVMLTVEFRWLARALFGAYALVIAFATLALGEHYLVDLVASFPILLAIAALCVERVSWSEPRRWQALAAGAAMYFAWALLLRPEVTHVAVSVPMAMAAWCLVTVAASALLYPRLMKPA